MRILVLIALLFTFLVGSTVEIAYASAPDHACTHYQMDNADSTDDKPCHAEQDQNHEQNACDDCCCVHAHSMTAPITPAKTAFHVNTQNVIATTDNHYSVELSGLKRPPRL